MSALLPPWVCWTFSLRHLSIPMVTVFKNLGNIAITFGDWYFYGHRISWGVALSLILMVLAAFFAGHDQIEVNAVGYWWMGWNIVATAANVLLMRRVSGQLNPSTLNYIKNVLSLPGLTVMMIVSGELPGVRLGLIASVVGKEGARAN